jgi:hypothetical protein
MWNFVCRKYMSLTCHRCAPDREIVGERAALIGELMKGLLGCFAGQAIVHEPGDNVPDETVLDNDGISEVNCIFRQMLIGPLCSRIGDRRQQEDRALIVHQKISGLV